LWETKCLVFLWVLSWVWALSGDSSHLRAYFKCRGNIHSNINRGLSIYFPTISILEFFWDIIVVSLFNRIVFYSNIFSSLASFDQIEPMPRRLDQIWRCLWLIILHSNLLIIVIKILIVGWDYAYHHMQYDLLDPLMHTTKYNIRDN